MYYDFIRIWHSSMASTGCPTRYQTRHFFNNFTTNEDIAKQFEVDLLHCVRNLTTTNVLLFKFRCNIFIGVRIIKEMPGSVASGTPCIFIQCRYKYINAKLITIRTPHCVEQKNFYLVFSTSIKVAQTKKRSMLLQVINF